MSTTPEPESRAAKSRPRRRVVHITLSLVLWIIGLATIGAIGLSWYATTPVFQNRLRHAVIAHLEKATGGRVELGRFSWRLSHLEFEVDNLTIHGLEAPGEIPYAHLDRLFVRLRILSFFRPKINLSYLEADRPVFHLIVYPDGTTNQPRPKHPAKGDTKSQIFNLAIGRTVLSDGVAIVNQQRIPFSLAVNRLGAQLSYVAIRDHYTGTIHAEDIVAQRGAGTPIHSVLDLSLDVGRNTARIVSLTLQSGPAGARKKTVLQVDGSLDNFADPHWRFSARGAVDALEIRALTGLDGLTAGTAELDASARGLRRQFVIDSTSRLTGFGYSVGTVHLTGITGSATARISEDLIAVDNLRVRLASGGTVNGAMRITHWLTPAARPGRTSPVQQGAIRANIAGFSLDSILDEVSPPHYRRFGFNTSASGTAKVDWTGSPLNLIGSVAVWLAPAAASIPGEAPMSGVVEASYINRTGTVEIGHLDVHTPESHINATGSLGVWPLNRASHLNATLISSAVDQFNPALNTLGLTASGGASPIPALIHGQLRFQGEMTGSLDSPAFSGHLQAADFDVVPRAFSASAASLHNIHFDSLTSDASYAAGALDIRAATLVEGKTTFQFSGHVHGRRDRPEELFADSSAIQATVHVTDLDLAHWVALTGRDIPVSGSATLDARTAGTIGDLDGSGHLTITGGSVYREPYRSLTSDLAVQGRSIAARNLVFSFDGGRVNGNAGYNFGEKTISFSLQGSGFQIARIPRLQNAQYPVKGTVTFDARGSGTLENPSLQASLHLRDLNLARESSGFVDAEAHTEGRDLLVHMSAHLSAATIDLNDRTQLRGDYQSQASLSISRLDIDPLLRTFSVTGIRGNSSIAATLNVSGPLRTPKQLRGDAGISQLDINLEGVPIRSQGPIHAALRDGTLHLDPLHIVGTDTDLHASGTVGLFATGRPVNIRASGGINMSLLQTVDTSIISSGRVDFDMTAQGPVSSPDLEGKVRFTNVNVALEDYINGLSRMNGSLAFSQNRLVFDDVTGYSGGGLLKIGGFVTWRHGIYSDLTATAKGVRIRYPQGVTATADAKIAIQGTTSSSFVSGNVTITGFAISPDVDFAAVAASTSGVSLPPDPNSPANHVRLDIRINSAPSLDFQNSFAKLAGNVSLTIRGTLAQPTVLGRVTITEGSATFNGARFQLQHGDIYFSNPVRIQPVLDLIATTTVEDYNITISLQGTTSKLNPTFRSEPPLSEQDIFSLLAMGRTQEEQQIYSTEEAQAGVNTTADTILGGALNATLSSRIQKLFGGGSVRIDPTFVSGVGNATARITIQEPISRKAILTYATNVNSTAEQLIQGEWRVTPDFSVLAVRDEAGVFSLIFRLHRRYH